jgi:hypothetical protein
VNECIKISDILISGSSCSLFKAVNNDYHVCIDCVNPYSLRQLPNIQNSIKFHCI